LRVMNSTEVRGVALRVEGWGATFDEELHVAASGVKRNIEVAIQLTESNPVLEIRVAPEQQCLQLWHTQKRFDIAGLTFSCTDSTEAGELGQVLKRLKVNRQHKGFELCHRLQKFDVFERSGPPKVEVAKLRERGQEPEVTAEILVTEVQPLEASQILKTVVRDETLGSDEFRNFVIIVFPEVPEIRELQLGDLTEICSSDVLDVLLSDQFKVDASLRRKLVD